MDYNSHIPNIYDFTEKPILKTLEIIFNNNIDNYNNYDIIINDINCNHLRKNNKHIGIREIISFAVIGTYFKLKSLNPPVFYTQTNCNNALNYELDYDIDGQIYPLFEGYSNLLLNNTFIRYSNKNKIKNKFIKLYFYHSKYYYNSLSDDYSVDTIIYGQKCLVINDKKEKYDYIDNIKYFYFNVQTINNNNYEQHNNSIIKLKVLHENLNPFDIVCVINIIENYNNTLTIIFSPIKIINNKNQYYEINFYDKSCTECYYNINKKIKNYYSKCIYICEKHIIKQEQQLIKLFEYDEVYSIDMNNMFDILKHNYNLCIDPKKKTFRRYY